jgi:hypothetical protein
MLRQPNARSSRGTVPHEKLYQFLSIAEIDSDEGFQRMCWNLRIDQRTMWEQIAGNPTALKLIKKIPMNRLRSAIDDSVRTEPIAGTWDDMPFGLR